MIYTPKNERMWDCWILHHNNTYYMYYLSLSPERLGKGSWDGISLATSNDLVHWTEYGRIFEKRPEAEWIGTGMVQKIGEKFIMNFSEECPAGKQAIYFAESTDLIHWTRTDCTCEPDGIYYMNKPEHISNTIPRWDSIGIVDAMDDKEPPYYGFLTSNTLQYKTMNKSGSLGLLRSYDGLHWECLPNAFPDTDAFPQFEVPEHVEINGRHYVIFCTSSYLGFRFDKYSNDMSGGTFYVTSDNLTGPYRLPDGDFMLQGSRDNVEVSIVSVGRPLKIENQIHYYHIWGGNGPVGWGGTLKLIEEEKPYKLRLRYDSLNDSLFGKKLADENWFASLEYVKNVGKVPPMLFEKDKTLKFTNLGTAAALEGTAFCGKTGGEIADLSDGRIVEAKLRIEEKGEGVGFYFLTPQGKRLGVMLNRKRNRVEFGYITFGWGANMVFSNDLCQSFVIPHICNVKLLVRRGFFELYVDDIYASSWRVFDDVINPNKMGLYFEDADGELLEFAVTEMK